MFITGGIFVENLVMMTLGHLFVIWSIMCSPFLIDDSPDNGDDGDAHADHEDHGCCSEDDSDGGDSDDGDDGDDGEG